MDLLLARLFDHSCKFTYTLFEEARVVLVRSWSRHVWIVGRQPVAIMPTFRWAKFLERRSRSSVSRVWPGCHENRLGQKRTRADKTRELAGNEGSSGDSSRWSRIRGQKHELVTTSLFLHRDFLGDLVRIRSPCSSIVF